MTRIGLIGLGHWGPNYVRVLQGNPDVRIISLCDRDTSRLERVHLLYPDMKTTTDYRELLADPAIDAVIIATPTAFHFEMGKQALEHQKHVLMEKPLALSTQDAAILVRLAREKDRILMVGHTFLFNPGVTALRELIAKGELGKIHYLNLMRANLGPIRNDVNALIDLAPHDISILLHILGKMPISVSAQGACYLKAEREDVVFLTLRFPEEIMAHIHVSWLEPVKVRRVTVIGDRKMAVFNDIDPVEPLRLYDKGVRMEPQSYTDFHEFRLIIRDGDVLIPKIPFSEPLKNECQAFVDAIRTEKMPLSDGKFGENVVSVLEAATQSLKTQGGNVTVIAPK